MFSGRSRVDWLLQFNSKYINYAEDSGIVYGAYGFRWRKHFGIDQILRCVELLRENKNDRRAMIGMWDPGADLGVPARDVPCNTHIYLRVSQGALDMTVCNRSNDLIWGMLGANVVHMTYLQELLAHGIGVPVGTYRVFTQNLHMYENLPNFDRIWCTNRTDDVYAMQSAHPLLQNEEKVEDLLADCETFVTSGPGRTYKTSWMYDVAEPMFRAYLEKDFDKRIGQIQKIMAPDWQLACLEWAMRRNVRVG